MSYRTIIDPAERLVVARFTGPTTGDDLVEAMAASLQDPNFAQDFDGLVDLRTITLAQARPTKAREVAQFVTDQDYTRGRWVTLVGGPMDTALTMLYNLAAGDHHPHTLCSTLEEAALFLRRDVQRLQRYLDVLAEGS